MKLLFVVLLTLLAASAEEIPNGSPQAVEPGAEAQANPVPETAAPEAVPVPETAAPEAVPVPEAAPVPEPVPIVEPEAALAPAPANSAADEPLPKVPPIRLERPEGDLAHSGVRKT